MLFKEVFTELFALRATASYLLSVVVKEMFPQARLLGGQAGSLGFFYDFHLPADPPPLDYLEERMRALSKANKKIEIQEMVTASALGYLDHVGLGYRKKTLPLTDLHFFAKLGEFVDLVEEPLLESTLLEGFFGLTDCENLEKGMLRISGSAFFAKEDWKQFIKQKRSYQEENCLAKAKSWGFIAEVEEVFYLLPKGVESKKLFKQDLTKRACLAQFVPVEKLSYDEDSCSEPLASHTLADPSFFRLDAKVFQWIKESEEEELEEGRFSLLAPPFSTALYQNFFSPLFRLEQEMISSLQFIAQIFTMLELKIELVLISPSERGATGETLARMKAALEKSDLSYRYLKTPYKKGAKRVEIRFYSEDRIKRKWLTASLEVESVKLNREEKTFIRLSPCRSLERVLALMWEKGKIPFHLCPTQCRVIPVKEEELGYADEIFSLLEKGRGIRVDRDLDFTEPLSERVYRAEREGVPFQICIGKRERERRTFSLREKGQDKVEELNIDQVRELWN